MTNSWKLWVEAGHILSENPKAKIVCPECREAYLSVSDVRFGEDESYLERNLSCPECGAQNSLRLFRPKHK